MKRKQEQGSMQLQVKFSRAMRNALEANFPELDTMEEVKKRS